MSISSADIIQKITSRAHLPVLCAGDLNADISIVKVKGFSVQDTSAASARGEKRQAEKESSLTAGGTVGNTCSGIARLGVPVFMTGNIGDDSFGTMILDSLVNDGVDTRYVRRIKDGFTLVTVNVSNEQREREYSAAFPQTGSVIEQFGVSHISDQELESMALIYTSGMLLSMHSCYEVVIQLMNRAKKLGVPVAMDLNLRIGVTGWLDEYQERFEQALSCCDIVFGSGTEEYPVIFGAENTDKAVMEFAKEGRLCVVKSGADGARVYGPEGELAAMGGYKVPVVDTLGAGDAFNAGFIAALLQGFDMNTVLRWGNAAGGYSVGFNGARSCPTRAQILEFLQQH